FSPLPERRLVLVPSAARPPPGAKVFCHCSFEGRRHWLNSSAASACSMQNPFGRWRRDASHRSAERKGRERRRALIGGTVHTEDNSPESVLPHCGARRNRSRRCLGSLPPLANLRTDLSWFYVGRADRRRW